MSSKIYIDSISLLQLNCSNENIEQQCLILRPPQQKRCILLNMYRPPNGSLQIFHDTLSEALEQINQLENLEIFVLGDMNIDITDPRDRNAMAHIENLQQFELSIQ